MINLFFLLISNADVSENYINAGYNIKTNSFILKQKDSMYSEIIDIKDLHYNLQVQIVF